MNGVINMEWGDFFWESYGLGKELDGVGVCPLY